MTKSKTTKRAIKARIKARKMWAVDRGPDLTDSRWEPFERKRRAEERVNFLNGQSAGYSKFQIAVLPADPDSVEAMVEQVASVLRGTVAADELLEEMHQDYAKRILRSLGLLKGKR